jgi:hypothetical protein
VANEPFFPAESTLATLPRWAKVALAGRCASRVAPLPPRLYPLAAEFTNALIEASAAAVIPNSVSLEHPFRLRLFISTIRALLKEHLPKDVSPAAAIAVRHAAWAVQRAVNAAIYALQGDTSYAKEATQAVVDAISAALHSAVGFSIPLFLFSEGMRSDLDLLTRAVTAENWTDDTIVPRTFFGPLYPATLAPMIPEIAETTRWLYDQIGDYEPQPRITWSFLPPENLPTGVRAEIAVLEWDQLTTRDFRWEEVVNGSFFRGVLLSLWGQLLGDRQRKVLRTAVTLAGSS